ncbi:MULTISPECIES: hypothetical protein [unclassified Streptomyces]|uniref:hypothetical protein n=1 Tax=unclassified Streptomyces TaxID=2593676 RepID=UPI00382A3D41
MDKGQLSTITGATAPTLGNALTDLTKTGKIHRQMKDGEEVRGSHGLGAAPDSD